MEHLNEPQPIEVTCYSGHAYAQRPESFLWEGTRHKVQKVEKEWRQPGQKCFRVLTDENRLFELCYHEGGDSWSAIELI